MNRRFLLSVYLVLVGAAHAALAQNAQWQKIKLGGSASVEFPGAPTRKEVQGQQAYVYKDGQAIYLVVVAKEKNYEGAQPNEAALKSYYEGMMEGVTKAAGGGEVVQQSSFTVAGFTGMEAKFTTPSHPELPAAKYVRAVLVGGNAYVLQFWTSSELDEPLVANRKKFFNSFEPGVAKSDLPQASTGLSAYDAGRLTGKIGFYVVLAAGLFFLLRRANRSKKSNQG